MMRSKSGFLFAASALLAWSASAEQLYVSDKLVVNITDQASQDGKKVTTVESGDMLEVLERVEGFVHIRTEHGNEGWIKSSYLSAQVPAVRRIKDLEAQRPGEKEVATDSKYTQEIAQLQEKNKAFDAEVTALKKTLEEANARVAAVSASQDASIIPTAMPVTVEQTAASSAAEGTLTNGLSATAIKIIAGMYVVVGLAGFIAGYQWLARRIRKKYGRVKIY